jgi:Rhs element Vgr protein
MPSSPFTEDASLISFTILAAGKEIPSTYDVREIRIESYVNRISVAEITLSDGEPATQTFEVTDSDTFKPGTEVEIKLGYDSKNDSVFKGIVTKQSIRIDKIEGSILQITCKDKALKMTINRKNGIYENMKDSAIISQIAGAAGLSTAITDTTVQHKEVVQYYATDWDFILTRAEANGMVVITDSGKLTIAKPAVSTTPDLQVTYGFDLIEFDGELDATHQYSSIQANGWDISNQALLNATSTEPSVNAQGNITGKTLSDVLAAGTNTLDSSTPLSSDDLKAWADATLLKSRLSRFKGTLTFQGSASAKVNSTIKIIGMSDRFSGNAYVSGVVHTMEKGGKWATETKIGLEHTLFGTTESISSPIASGLLPGIQGLQTGIVKKINADPENEFRVQVEIPILGVDGKMVWARLSNFYVGNGFGAFFMPEVNDEVILGFFNDDPRYPIILGSLYSSKIAAPLTPDEKNSIKTLITQSKLQLKFDEENKVLSIITPGGNTIVLSDKDKGITLTDQNSNLVQMNDKGITLNSQSNITIKAAQDIKIEGINISLNGSQSVKAEGGQISVTGNQSVKIAGTAECAISSNGQMSVKGATVMIN